MDVRHLELLRELADRGTLTGVAAATYRTPSAVSQQLRSAERAAGVPLVEAHGRGVRLTRAGRILADGAVDVAEAMARVQRDLDALRDAPQGLVAIGALPSAAEVLVPELLVRLLDTDIRIELDDFDIAEADFAGRAVDHDIVIGHTLTDDAEGDVGPLRRMTLAAEPLDVALPAGHRLAGRSELTPEDVVGREVDRGAGGLPLRHGADRDREPHRAHASSGCSSCATTGSWRHSWQPVSDWRCCHGSRRGPDPES